MIHPDDRHAEVILDFAKVRSLLTVTVEALIGSDDELCCAACETIGVARDRLTRLQGSVDRLVTELRKTAPATAATPEDAQP